jgi:hypothetical protein
MSANSTVRRFRSPPLALSELSNWSDAWEDSGALIGLPQLSQNRLSIPLVWPQDAHFGPMGTPHPRQKELVSLLSLPHRGHFIARPQLEV